MSHYNKTQVVDLNAFDSSTDEDNKHAYSDAEISSNAEADAGIELEDSDDEYGGRGEPELEQFHFLMGDIIDFCYEKGLY